MHQPREYEEYKTLSLRDSEFFGPQLVQELPWGKNEIIVDYGCGAGSTGARFFLPSVQETNSKMFSIDCSSDMIAYAKSMYPDPHIEYRVGNIMKNPTVLGIEAIDKIFSVYTFQFIPCHRELFRRLWATLKPSGHLAFTMLTDICSFEILIYLGEHEKWGHYMKGYESFLPSWITDQVDCNVHQETQRNLEISGFEVKKLETHKLTYHYESVDTLVGLCMSVNPCIGKYPVELLPELQKEYKKILIDLHGNSNRNGTTNGYYRSDHVPVTVNYETIFAVAQKRMD